jgi:hypothetical protein
MSYLVGALSAYECCYGLGSLCRFDKSLYLSEEWPSVLSSFFFREDVLFVDDLLLKKVDLEG